MDQSREQPDCGSKQQKCKDIYYLCKVELKKGKAWNGIGYLNEEGNYRCQRTEDSGSSKRGGSRSIGPPGVHTPLAKFYS